MPIIARLSGLQNIDDIRVRQGGSIRQCTDVYARVGGNIELVWQLFTVDLSGLDGNTIVNTAFTTGSPVTSTARLRLESDGSGDAGFFSVWGEPARAGIGEKYEARLTVQGGESPTGGSAVGSWLLLDTQREWTLSVTASTFASEEGQWRIEIRREGTTQVVDSADFTIRAEVQTI